MVWKAATVVKNLQEHFPEMTSAAAKSLAKVIRNAGDEDQVDVAMEAANSALNGHGVESLQADELVDRYYRYTAALYVNKGRTYATTILYDTAKGKFIITSWGDWLEHMESTGEYHFG